MTFEGAIPIPPDVIDVQKGGVNNLSIRFLAPNIYYIAASTIIAFYDQLLFTQGWQRCIQNCYAVKYRRTDIVERIIYQHGRVPYRQFLDVVIIPAYQHTSNAGHFVIVRRDNCDSTNCVRPNDQEIEGPL